MTKKYEAYLKAQTDREQAVNILSLIGKDQTYTTAKAKGFIHSLKVNLSVHFQERDGAKSYHTSVPLDAALSKAALKNWRVLSDDAREILQLEERDRLIDCEDELAQIQDRIREAKS